MRKSAADPPVPQNLKSTPQSQVKETNQLKEDEADRQKLSKKMAKVSRKPLSRQWGSRPNTFTCSLCHKSFITRKRLRVHKEVCIKDESRVRGLIRELKPRFGPHQS
jgi:hypothetical protein